MLDDKMKCICMMILLLHNAIGGIIIDKPEDFEELVLEAKDKMIKHPEIRNDVLETLKKRDEEVPEDCVSKPAVKALCDFISSDDFEHPWV